MTIKMDFNFDKENYRQYLNGEPVVMHCHHYLTLTTKLAEDHDEFGGIKILRESAESAIRKFLDSYHKDNSVSKPEERLEIGQEFYAALGLGKMVISGDANGGEVILQRSHVDEGWMKKWDRSDTSHNHFTCGFVCAVFGAAFDKPNGSYEATEVEAIVKGDPQGKLTVQLS